MEVVVGYSIISCLCLTILVATLLLISVKLTTQKRSERTVYVRNYKKGMVIIVYIVFIPLYFLANLYNGTDIMPAVFDSIKNSVELVAFKLNLSTIQPLMNANAYYRITMYFGFSYVIFNSIMFLFSLFSEIVWRMFYKEKFLLSRKSKCFIVGNIESSKIIYETCGMSNKILVDNFSKEDKYNLYLKNIHFININDIDSFVDKIIKESCRFAKYNQKHHYTSFSKAKKINVIINVDDINLRINLCSKIASKIQNLNEYQLGVLNICVYTDQENIDVYSNIEANCKGALHNVNKYSLSAMDFVERFPLTKFMDDRQIDYETSLINPDANINTIIIGFGKRNRQVFLSMIANNQFLQKIDKNSKEVEVKKVDYYIFDKFDKDQSRVNKSFNHNYYRFKHNFIDIAKKIDLEEYLPLPTLSSTEHFEKLDINEKSFYDQIKGALGKNQIDINYIVISLGDMFVDIDMANKINVKLKEWGLTNTYVFTSVSNYDIAKNKNILLPYDNCYIIGEDKTCEYNYDKIVDDKFVKMAKQRDYMYNIEYDMIYNNLKDITPEYLEKQAITSLRNWYLKRTHLERQSNLYAILSIRQKLNLMGLDYVEKEKPGQALTEKEYLDIYAKDDLPEDYTTCSFMNKKIIKYTLNFKESRRKTMAMLEHDRWNAYMLTQGFVPASKQEIMTAKNENGRYTNGKNYLLRKHGNLTTFEGLEQFRKMLDERDALNNVQDKFPDFDAENLKSTKNDVIKYDYQILDDVYWLLDSNGYKIVKR